MSKTFIILEIQGEFVWFANATSTEPPVRYTEEEAAREIDSFIRQRPTSRFLVVDISL